MVHTNSLSQEDQKTMANRFAANYEHAQSLLRPVKPTIRAFGVSLGGTEWTMDNGINLRVSYF
jgi:hypothetical protein